MLILANSLRGIAIVLSMLINLMLLLLLVRVIVSWVNADPYNPIVRFIVNATEPLLRPLRRIMPAIGSLDLSPILLVLILYFIKAALVDTLYDQAERMRLQSLYSFYVTHFSAGLLPI